MQNQGTGDKTWMERGVGDIRLLQHRSSGQIRVLMRHENTMKVICNHVLDSQLELTPNSNNAKSWVWKAFDFADGSELVETMFACRFKDLEHANSFKEAFEKYQLEMKQFCEGGDDVEDTSVGNMAAHAFRGVSTTDN